MNDAEDMQRRADAYIEDWSRGKRDFKKVRQRMGEVCATDINLTNSGRPGLGVVRNGQLDLDHAYFLAKQTHPETLAEIRRAERREKAYERPAETRDPGPTVRQSILRSIRENAERS
jgi:hypothetical protein